MKKQYNEEWKKNMVIVGKKSLALVLAGGLALGGLGIASRKDVSAASPKEASLTKAEQDGTQNTSYNDVADIVEKAMPAVVTITTKSIKEVENYFGMFGFYGYAPRIEREVEGGGSGFIIGWNDDELLIATNYHVVEGADTLSIAFVDNSAYKGVVKGYDETKDVAVVAVAREDLTEETVSAIDVAVIGNSDELRVGERVVVIGNAMGYGQSATTGIVSSKSRQMNDEEYSFSTKPREDDGVNLIQTDAAINPGNSGGMLLNMDGEVVGISNSKTASTLVEGMCYAIAISDVEDVLTDIMNQKTREKVAEGKHGALGIRATSVSAEAHQVYGIPEGAFVVDVDEGSAAEEAGIEKNMIITRLDSRKIGSVETLVGLLEYYEPGEEVEIEVSYQDGNSYASDTYTVTLQESETDEDESKSDSKDKDEDEDEDSDDWDDDWYGDDESEDDDRFGDAGSIWKEWFGDFGIDGYEE
ncbi:MAG: trypsin-like peptidase domain-containing protein [Blautia sp.]|nr:trypsin-like peptidase domain-containing protein [Blautia sp.]